MSAMSASPPVGPAALMPLSLIAEHKVAPGVPKLPAKPPQPPTANGMEAALPLAPQELPPPVLHNSTAPPPDLAALPQPTQQHPVQESAKAAEMVGVTSSSSGPIGGGEGVKLGGAEAPGGEGAVQGGGVGSSEEAAVVGGAAAVEATVEAAAAETAPVVQQPQLSPQQQTPPPQPQQTPPPPQPQQQPAATPAAAPAPAPAPSPPPAAAPPPPTTPPQQRQTKRKPVKVSSEDSGNKKEDEDKDDSGDGRKSKRVRLPTQPYQSPIPELHLIAKLDKPPAKTPDDKLIVFYRNEFLAVRNAEGGYYVCQAMQNIYKSSSRLRIRWLSQDEGDLYTPDFYDTTEFDCILTNLNLERVEKNKFRLPPEESQRTESILKRAIDVEKGVADNTAPTEEHPDGLDLSLYRNEEQLKRRKSRSKKSKSPKKKKSPLGKSRGSSRGKSSGSDESSSGSSEGSKKRGSVSRGTKKRSLSGSGKKAANSTNKRQVGGKREAGGKKEGGKRKAVTTASAGGTTAQPPEKRPRRAAPNHDTKTRSAAVGAAGKGRRSLRN